MNRQEGHPIHQLETGEGEDAGRTRLSFFHNGKRVRLTCSEDGTFLKTLRTVTRAR
jgi:hypothetical protein